MSTINSINNKTGPLTITDNADPTKEVSFVVSGVSGATTRTLTMDDRNVNFDAVPTSIVTDAGTCTPAGGSFSIVGAGTTSTSGAGSTVTVTGAGGGGASTCSFLAYLGTQDANVTGDGSTFNIGSGNALTEIYDVGADFNTNGIFTAPSTDLYTLGYIIESEGYGSSHDYSSTILITSNREYRHSYFDPYVVMGGAGILTISNALTADFDAADTAVVEFRITGSTKVIDVNACADATDMVTCLFGNLIS